MAHFKKDRVRDTTTTIGTNPLVLLSAVPTGYQGFSTMAVGDTCFYSCVHQSANEWETGLATLSAAATLTRTTVLESSNANAAVNFSVGTKDVWVDLPSSQYLNHQRNQRLFPAFETELMSQTFPQGNWSAQFVSAGTLPASATGVMTANHPGCLTVTSSTTANSGAAIVTLALLLLGGGEQFDCVFKTGAAFTNTTMRLGFHDTLTSADAVDGCYLEVGTTGIVTGKTSSNSVRTTSATITTLAVATWYHARVKLNANATAVDFTVFDDSGTQLGTVNVTTNIPTVSGRETGAGFIATNAGVVATALAHVDYIAVMQGQGRQLVRGALI